jgi:hypothetical protein
MKKKEMHRRRQEHRLNVCNWVLGYVMHNRRSIEEALRTYGYDTESLAWWLPYVTHWVHRQPVLRCGTCGAWHYSGALYGPNRECTSCFCLPAGIGQG